MPPFKEYQTSQNDDGTLNIHGVEIFRLGTHKGFTYDSEWAEKAIATHQKLQAEGFQPSVIIGHNEPGQAEEKPAKGFFRDLKIDGELILADLVGIQPDTYEALKRKEYPHRSVELINPEENRFSALALLGGTSPYHKLPVLEVFQEHPEATWVHFQGVDLQVQMDRDDKLSKVREVYWKMMEAVDRIAYDQDMTDDDKVTEIKAILSQGVEMMQTEVETFKEEQTMPPIKDEKQFTEEYTRKFAEEHGITPEEAVKRAKAAEESLAKEREEKRIAGIAAFGETLKQGGLAPKFADRVVGLLTAMPADTTVKFADGATQPGVDAIKALFTDMVDAGKKNELGVPFGETTAKPAENATLKLGVSEDSEDPMADRKAVHEKARELMRQEPKLSYNEALNRVISA